MTLIGKIFGYILAIYLKESTRLLRTLFMHQWYAGKFLHVLVTVEMHAESPLESQENANYK